MSRNNPSPFAPEDGSERGANTPGDREPKRDRTSHAAESVKKAQERFKHFTLSKFRESKTDRGTSLAAESVKKAQERFNNFSLSKFSVAAMPPNYVPHMRELPAAERAAHVQEFQRKKIEQQLKQPGKVDSPNLGLKLAVPADAVAKLLPSYSEKESTLELSELMDLVHKQMRGTEFFNRGNPTLTRITLHARAREALELDGEENTR
jgi:hypothetical protein